MKDIAKQYLAKGCIPTQVTEVWINFQCFAEGYIDACEFVGIRDSSTQFRTYKRVCAEDKEYFQTFYEKFLQVHDHVTRLEITHYLKPEWISRKCCSHCSHDAEASTREDDGFVRVGAHVSGDKYWFHPTTVVDRDLHHDERFQS